MPRKNKIKFQRSNLKFSKEQRIKIVQEIESHQLTRSEAMEKYNIVATNTLLSWISRHGSPNSKAGNENQSVRKVDKRQAAYKVMTGEATVHEIARKMNVGLHAVWGWIRATKKEVSLGKTPGKLDASVLANNHLEVDDLRLKILALETMIDIAEKELQIDIRKKSGTKQ